MPVRNSIDTGLRSHKSLVGAIQTISPNSRSSNRTCRIRTAQSPRHARSGAGSLFAALVCMYALSTDQTCNAQVASELSSVMRQLQSRHHHVDPGSNAEWPQSSILTTPTPAYPAECFFEDLEDYFNNTSNSTPDRIAKMAEVLSGVYSEFASVVPHFVNESSYADMQSGGNPSTVAYQLADFPDVVTPCESLSTIGECEDCLTALGLALGGLRRSFRQYDSIPDFTQLEHVQFSGSSSRGDDCTCDTIAIAPQVISEAISDAQSSAGISTSSGFPAGSASVTYHAGNNVHSINVAVSSHDATYRSPYLFAGVAEVWGKVHTSHRVWTIDTSGSCSPPYCTINDNASTQSDEWQLLGTLDNGSASLRINGRRLAPASDVRTNSWSVTDILLIVDGSIGTGADAVYPELPVHEDCTDALGNLAQQAPQHTYAERGEAGVSLNGCPTLPTSGCPVVVADGSKTERIVDLTVTLNGSDFEFVRDYTSNPIYLDEVALEEDGGGNLLGQGWSSPTFRALAANGTGYTLYGSPVANRVEYEQVFGSPSYRYSSGGSTAQFMARVPVEYNGESCQVLRLMEPGGWVTDFGGMLTGTTPDMPSTLAKLRGLPLLERDRFGNQRVFGYELKHNAARLAFITLNSRPPAVVADVNKYSAGSVNSAAEIYFGWVTDAGSAAVGRLSYVEVRRRISGTGTWVVTDRVDYSYASSYASSELSTDVGAGPQLVQVKTSRLVDCVNDAIMSDAYHSAVTQYRYHDASSAGTNDDERLNIVGKSGQLKLAIDADQIEYYAQKRAAHEGGTGSWSPENALATASAELLALNDGDSLAAPLSSYRLVDLANKLVAYNQSTGKVEAQYNQTACGCGGGGGGGTQGLKQEYSYHTYDWDGTAGITVRIDERTSTDAGVYSTNVYRKRYYDMQRLGDAAIPYLRFEATEDAHGKRWAHAYGYNINTSPAGRRERVRHYTPSAIVYTPFNSLTQTPPSVTINATGLMYGYAYANDDGIHRSETHIGVPDSTDVSDIDLTDVSGIPLVEFVHYPATSSTTGTEGSPQTRLWLPTMIERYRSLGSTDSDKEVTSFTYGFRNNGVQEREAIDKTKVLGMSPAWIKTTTESGLESENGPGSTTTYSKVEFYDGTGANTWTIELDNSLTRRAFNAETGALVAITRNAVRQEGGSDTSEPEVIASPLSKEDPANSGVKAEIEASGRWTDGGSLTTTLAFDLLGRPRSIVSPSGKAVYTYYQVRDNSERPGIRYAAAITLPQQVSETSGYEFDGPAAVSWSDAAGRTIRTSGFEVDPEVPYEPESGTYTLTTELSRSTIEQHLSGLVEKSRVWHDIGQKWHNSEASCRDESTFTYDELGRVDIATAPNGTRVKYTYDALDRIVEEAMGTTESNFTTVREMYFDSGGTTTQGVGNGNLTLLREHTGECSGLGAVSRDHVREYDERDRLVLVKGPASGGTPEPPHTYFVYDNLDRITARGVFETVPTGITSPDRTHYETTFYNQRGLVYKTQRAIDPSNDSVGFLENHIWRDSSGRPIAEWGPNGLATKRVYDGLGRVTAEYVTDRHQDADPGATDNWDHASSIDDDHVIEQIMAEYDEVGRKVLSWHVARSQDDDDEGAIDSNAAGTSTVAVQSFVGYVYDEGDRLASTINYGTNQASVDEYSAGGLPPTVPTTPPDPDTLPKAIVTSVKYNSRGLLDQEIDPREKVTRHLYDDAGRSIATVRNHVDASVNAASTKSEGRWVLNGVNESSPDEDVSTSVTYDGIGNISRRITHLHSASPDSVQITEYIYDYATRYGTSDVGTCSTETDSLIAVNGRLYEVRYPNESTGQAGTSNALKVRYSYNVLGEVRSVTDQNATRHAYARDLHGRLVEDRVTDIPLSAVDSSVQLIRRKFDDSGRLDWVKSYDTVSGSTVLNAVRFRYDPLWHVKAVYQNHAGDVQASGGDDGPPVSPTRRVQSAYTAASTAATTNQSRLLSTTYPDDTTLVAYDYGAAGELDDRISRLREITMTGLVSGDPSSVVKYSYVGLDRVSVVDFALPNVQLDRTFSHDGKRHYDVLSLEEQNPGVFPGWDRFGRTKRLAWVDGALTHDNGVSTTLPTRPPIVEEVYAYDRSSRLEARTDARPGAMWTNRDFQFSYDEADRLATAKRGKQESVFTDGVGGQEWTLDALGNWDEVGTDGNGDGDSADNGETVDRSFNAANELVERKVINNSPQPHIVFPMSYDDNGNLVENPLNSLGNKREFIYDAWNRLVKVRNVTAFPATTKYIGYYQYNGLNWRVVARMDAATPVGLDQQRIYTYDADWRILQEEIDNFTNDSTGLGSPDGTNRHVQQVWGVRGIDDPVLRRVDRNGDGDYLDSGNSDEELNDRAYVHLTDALGSTVGMVRADNGYLVERVSYSSYGTAIHRYTQDVNNDGQVDSGGAGTDRYAIESLAGTQMIVSGALNSAYDVALDLDRDGVIDGTSSDPDLDAWDALGSHSSPPGNGLISDKHGPDNVIGYAGYVFATETKSSLARNRWYEPVLGRWMNRDPAGYVDGLNLYEYVQTDPLTGTDPFGLDSDDESLPAYRQRVKDRIEQLRANGLFGYVRPGDDVLSLAEDDLRRRPPLAIAGERSFACDDCPSAVRRRPGDAEHNLGGNAQDRMALQLAMIEAENDVAPIGRFVGGVGMTFASSVPLVGEYQDLQTVRSSDARWWERALAGVSLVFNGATAGLLPNYSSIRRATGAADDLLDAARAERRAPIWSTKHQMSSVENALDHWNRHRHEFPNINNATEYVDAARSFAKAPPPGTLTIIRKNGEVVLYHPESNTFAVTVSAGGPPKTMFKPDPLVHGYPTNMDYFNAQK